MKRFKIGATDIPRCPACGIRLNTTSPYCSVVCRNSLDAQYRRDMERTGIR